MGNSLLTLRIPTSSPSTSPSKSQTGSSFADGSLSPTSSIPQSSAPSSPISQIPKVVSPKSQSNHKNYRFLCLHGWRTSGKILSFQSAALCANVGINGFFPDAPFSAEGAPDAGIATFYPDYEYYEWYLKRFDVNDPTIKLLEGVDQSISKIVDIINNEEQFDGILGFSQGAAMATMILTEIQNRNIEKGKLIKCVILIGGVPPVGAPSSVLSIPSLHIMGEKDSLISYSKELEGFYDKSSKSVMIHEEGHNVPSMRTELYPLIRSWIEKHMN